MNSFNNSSARRMFSIVVAVVGVVSIALAQSEQILEDVNAEVELIVSRTTIILEVEIANRSDGTLAILPFQCLLHRVTPCRKYFKRGGYSLGFVVPWRLESNWGRTHDCNDIIMAPSNVEPYPPYSLLRHLRLQFVVIQPGQRARFRWRRPFAESQEFLTNSTCAIDTFRLPAWKHFEQFGGQFEDCTIRQQQSFRLYEMETRSLSDSLYWDQDFIIGEPLSCSLYESSSSRDKWLLFDAMKDIIIAPGPNVTCTVIP